MKKILKSTIYVSILIFMISSCKEAIEGEFEPLFEPSNEVILIPNTAKLSNLMNFRVGEVINNLEAEEFAKMLAHSLKDKDLRQFLKAEAGKRFDGDYDILVNQISDAKVGNSKFYEKVSSNSIKGKEVFDNALKNNLLNISIPLFNEVWNDKTQIPLVGVALDFNEKSTKFIKAFDKFGKSYLIDCNIEPNVAVIIIGNNERVKYINGEYIKINENINSKSKSSFNLKTQICSYPFRINNNYEVLRAMKFSNLSDYESWVKGSPEIKIDIIAPTSSSNYSSPASIYSATINGPNRNQIDGTYWNIPSPIPLYYWDAPTKSNTMFYQFTEMDNSGTSYTLSLGLGVAFKSGAATALSPTTTTTLTTGFSVTFQDKDDEIGKTTIEQFICPYNSDNSYQLGNGFNFMVGN